MYSKGLGSKSCAVFTGECSVRDVPYETAISFRCSLLSLNDMFFSLKMYINVHRRHYGEKMSMSCFLSAKKASLCYEKWANVSGCVCVFVCCYVAIVDASACTYIFKHKNKWAIWSKHRKIRNFPIRNVLLLPPYHPIHIHLPIHPSAIFTLGSKTSTNFY